MQLYTIYLSSLKGREALLKALQGKQPLRTEEKVSQHTTTTTAAPTESSMYILYVMQWSWSSFSHLLLLL